MPPIFSGLPNDIIIQIVQIEDRRKYEKERMKYREVVKQLNKFLPEFTSIKSRPGRMHRAHLKLGCVDSRHQDYLLQLHDFY